MWGEVFNLTGRVARGTGLYNSLRRKLYVGKGGHRRGDQSVIL